MGISEFDEAWDEDDADRHREEERKVGEALLAASIRTLEPREAVTVPESATIGEAVQTMLDRGIGALLVTRSDGSIAGIFTERDVMRRVAISGVDRTHSVSEVMTADPESLGPDDGVAFALNRMVVEGYRHIPIVDGENPLGILSVRDVVRYIVSLMPARVLNLPPEPSLEARSPDGG